MVASYADDAGGIGSDTGRMAGAALVVVGVDQVVLTGWGDRLTRSMRKRLAAMRAALPCAFSCTSALTRSTVE